MMGAPKNGLPAGAIRIIAKCSSADPISLDAGEQKVAAVLAGRGFLEEVATSPGTFVATHAGLEMLVTAVDEKLAARAVV